MVHTSAISSEALLFGRWMEEEKAAVAPLRRKPTYSPVLLLHVLLLHMGIFPVVRKWMVWLNKPELLQEEPSPLLGKNSSRPSDCRVLLLCP